MNLICIFQVVSIVLSLLALGFVVSVNWQLHERNVKLFLRDVILAFGIATIITFSIWLNYS